MRFWVLRTPLPIGEGIIEHPSADMIREEPIIDGEASRCPVCGDYTSLIPWLPPLTAEIEVWGGAYPDLIEGSDGAASARFVELFRSEGLTGLEDFEPIHVRRFRFFEGGKPKGEPPRYFRVKPIRKNARLDLVRSQIEWKDGAPGCLHCLTDTKQNASLFVVDRSTWAGEDCFKAWGLPGYWLVSERFHEFWRRHKITGVGLVPLNKMRIENTSSRFNPADMELLPE